MISIACVRKTGARLPVYATAGAAGADVSAFLPEGDVRLEPGMRLLVPTGLRVAIPAGYELQVRPRSGLALRSGLTCLNTPGTIDSDYRGEIGVILINLGDEAVTIHDGDRIAQLVLSAAPQASFIEAGDLGATDRADAGFGSTGR